MQTMSFSQIRQNLATTIDSVVHNHSPIIITRQNKEPVVIISLDDYKSIEETVYLMQSMTNATRLNSAISQLEAGQGITRELAEDGKIICIAPRSPITPRTSKIGLCEMLK